MATNLAITYCVPEGVAPWKGEEGTTVPITVNLEDNDPNDAMTLTLTLYATNADNRGPWTGVRTMIQENVTGTQYTFYWDGKNNSGAYVEPWTYTFEVDITQTDINYNENPALQVADSTEYRSKYLDILRSRDAFNNPIYEAEYAGYDEGDPNDPNDDSYLYYIRFYDLKDTLDVDASEGELWLYDPDLEQIYTWDVASLECLIEGHTAHDHHDGLHANSTGIMHELLVPVPVSLMQYAGDYRFVLHIKDDHLDKYRDHRKRWARDLNAREAIFGYAIIYTDDSWRNLTGGDKQGASDEARADEAKDMLESMGYRGWKPIGNPAGGGSGKIKSTTSRLGIRTLKRLAPGDTGKVSKNAIWVWYGHASGHTLGFVQKGENNQPIWGQRISNNVNPETDKDFNINNAAFNLNHVLFAYLAGCSTAGTREHNNPNSPGYDPNVPHIPETSTDNSIANSFLNKGVKAVVGFYDHTFLTRKDYEYFNEGFWLSVRWEFGVRRAISETMKDKKMRAFKRKYKGKHPVNPIPFGADKVLMPARYGN